MLFNSFGFLLVFFPLVLIALHLSKKRSSEMAMGVIVLASLAFYSWWDWRYTPVLIASLVFNYAYGHWLLRDATRAKLFAGIAINLAPLVFWKYTRWISGEFGEAVGPSELPLGISFFTFLQISYLVEIFRGKLIPGAPLPYLSFVTYFPHLIAGPILKYEEMKRQFCALNGSSGVSASDSARGWILLSVGLFKKVIIADQLCAPYVGPVFDAAESATFYEAWMGALAYTGQLYFDFSGYCEMALGMSLIMGIAIPINFLSPYRSASISEFWRRWHISLGHWFRDYVYIPLGGSRHGFLKTSCVLLVTMLLAGAWHGAGWTFIVWGLMHGAMLVAHRAWTTTGFILPRGVAVTATLIAVMFAWVIFRADSVADALALWHSMAGLNGVVLPSGFEGVAAIFPSWVTIEPSVMSWGTEVPLLVLLLCFCATARNVHELEIRPSFTRAVGVGAMGMVSAFYLATPSTFLYFQF